MPPAISAAMISFAAVMDHRTRAARAASFARASQSTGHRPKLDRRAQRYSAVEVASQSTSDCWRVIFWGTSISFRRLFGENLAAVVVEVTDG